MAVDTSTANRIRDEFITVRDGLQGIDAGSAVDDPLGVDGAVTVEMVHFRNTGGGEVVLRKENDQGDVRYTHFRAWGAGGTDYVEKASYLIKANGVKQFFKKRVEADDQIISANEPDGDDNGWMAKLA